MAAPAALADTALADRLVAGLGGTLPPRLGVAVSGGGDSMALLSLLHGLCAAAGTQLEAVTVDHGLRPEAATEAAFVAHHAGALGLPHETLQWRGWDGQGNLQNAAREARYRLMADWAARRDLPCIALGHTADDQAETVLMRLARRSGVDGLSAMAPQSRRHGVTWLRPLLFARRESLRDYLRRAGLEWVDDPSNDDPRYARIQTRQSLAALDPLGIDVETLAEVASNMATARDALERQTERAAGDILRMEGGALVMRSEAFFAEPEEIRRRLMIRALGKISGSAYSPRRGPVAALIAGLAEGQAATLDGCQALVRRGEIWLFREYNAVRDLRVPVNHLWDKRWRAVPSGGAPEGAELRALGPEGLAQCPNWRSLGRPRAMLLSTPAIWQGAQLLAAPLAGLDEKWHVLLESGAEWINTAPLSH
ncbi:tRNA(Ile)-lysidine synthase [Sulfitobacter indolifex]|uniref:tRNA(Ile)-lysidine synthase n=1 Tax=Sulfitobacter indolifex HEL-45 TaxID=391624 RepID=A0ABP2D9I2_9RHOB|nr:tRNA lysidine(34) synthetase TilS [Sulfitobacter indolifex]EDQ04983.1 PP-loop family protein [Sulfitobacter indolifex HEL-45]UOA18033.1 tRNA(Ile)-lysidine synthase [Sulfitobacter indolifex]